MGLGILRLQLQCPAVAGDRLVQLPLLFQGSAQVGMGLSPVGLHRQGATDAPCGSLRIAGLAVDHAQQKPRAGLVRRDRENLPADLLGRLQPAGLMVLARSR